MVFTTLAAMVRARGPDEFWRKRKIFKLAAHYIGRRRNVYSVAVRNVHRALVYATKSRKLKKEDMSELWETRIAAGCEQHGLILPAFLDALNRNEILLNRKVLADLAIWEPKSFEALANIGRDTAVENNIEGVNEVDFDNKVFKK